MRAKYDEVAADYDEWVGGGSALDDPTFANGLLWITEHALETEGSGYYLIPAGPLPNGWSAVSDEEAGQIWGRGYPSSDTPGCVGPGNPSSGDDDDCGMAVCNTPCGDGKGCAKGVDCVSGVCWAGICQVPTCSDGRLNGTETGVDCGGSCAACGGP